VQWRVVAARRGLINAAVSSSQILHWEDVSVGELCVWSIRWQEDIVAFAGAFDPQLYLDEEAAKDSVIGVCALLAGIPARCYAHVAAMSELAAGLGSLDQGGKWLKPFYPVTADRPYTARQARVKSRRGRACQISSKC